ncbi:RagB/SusD family nutrient uptake outer membrane protein [Sphingobacterium sp. E70]|uniref:RagB/SusD family nutrient uptake outer membrane protein n=1 Tax=Sphingobacterium sp. E70 TaxID=2853439 RepID=UPI00211CA3A3|nr:RagB/SusD family nutrient uptake outer membrane protein [Sphingobacterium sp. E70]ULT22102.1 RagB/SusD family nutrient uptake outer membrane protein [Sphingobacterium sp. E70]
MDEIAVARGVKKTAALQLGAIANDPLRDGDVSPLMWEIRRERRMEFVFEYSRLMDLRRWKKLNYMDFSKILITLRVSGLMWQNKLQIF